jgi:hypothetical protein
MKRVMSVFVSLKGCGLAVTMLPLFVSCEERGKGEEGESNAAPARSRFAKIKEEANKKRVDKSKRLESAVETEEMADFSSRARLDGLLSTASEEDLRDRALELLSKADGGSSTQQKIAAIITELVRRNSDYLYAILDTLPPGTDSKDIVRIAFNDLHFDSLGEIAWLRKQFKDADLASSASSAMYGALAMGILSKTSNETISYQDLKNLGNESLPRDAYMKLIQASYSTGSVSLTDIQELLPSMGQQELGHLLQYLNSGDAEALVKDRLTDVGKLPLTERVKVAEYLRDRASNNGDSAIKFANSLPPAARDYSLGVIFGELSRRRPDWVRKFIEQTNDESLKVIAEKRLADVTKSK